MEVQRVMIKAEVEIGTITAEVTNDTIAGKVSSGTLNVTGIGYQAKAILNLDPVSLDFGETIVDSTAGKTLTIRNDGDLVLSGTLTISTNPAEFSVSTPVFSVSPDQQQVVTVSMTPQNNGAQSGKLKIISNDYTAGTVYMDLDGTGVTPLLQLTPNSVTFSDTPVGETASKQVKIRNLNHTWATELDVTSLTDNSNQYSVSPTSLYNIPPGDEKIVTIYFSPTYHATHNATVTVNSNDPNGPDQISLSGQGMSSSIDVNTMTLDYGKVLLGTSSNKTLTIQNDGAMVLTVTDITSSHGEFSPSTTSFS